jgi:hypothetical protein
VNANSWLNNNRIKNEENVIANLQERAIAAHGGLPRWEQLSAVRAHLIQGGVLWAVKGQAHAVDDVFVRVDLHRQFTSHYPIGGPGRHSVFRGNYVAVEDKNGGIVEERKDPRDSFADHTFETPWDTLQLAYFVGYAMWTYLTVPFSFAMPGFRAEELTPWKEKGETWRRLRVTYPPTIATHNAEQIFYFGDDGLQRRHDYTAEVVKGSPAAHYTTGHQEVNGIMVPTKHRVYPANPDGSVNTEPLIVSIDVSEIAFS